MKAPQIIMIVLFSGSVFITLAKHGRPKEGKENVFTALIACAIHIGLLIWGGFFK